MLTNPWMNLWTYLGIFLAAMVVGLAWFGTSRMRGRDPIRTRTDAAFQRRRSREAEPETRTKSDRH